jgi:sugar lactone lactonase YvrE
MLVGLALSAFLAVVHMGISPPVFAKGIKVVSEQTVTGFAFPESVAYDPQAKVLYVSEFGSQLKPTLKDGKGRISKVSLSGKVLEEQFLPAPGGILNKPKGIWVEGNRLWVTDIDVVWVFDLKTRRGRKVALPGVKFANDPTVTANVLYVSDNRGDQLYRVTPADFLNIYGDPKASLVFSAKSINPNGLYPARDGSLLMMVGFKSKDEARGIYALDAGGKVKSLSKALGRLDGVYQLKDKTLLLTDWNSGSLVRWSSKKGMQTLASGFKGPADFGVVPQSKGLMVVVPDLVKSELRMVQLAK